MQAQRNSSGLPEKFSLKPFGSCHSLEITDGQLFEIRSPMQLRLEPERGQRSASELRTVSDFQKQRARKIGGSLSRTPARSQYPKSETSTPKPKTLDSFTRCLRARLPRWLLNTTGPQPWKFRAILFVPVSMKMLVQHCIVPIIPYNNP